MTVLDRMLVAVERVRERMLRAALALEQAQIPYAVIGGNAVAAWVATVDPSAVRNTQDVDLLLEECSLERAKDALASQGFVFRHEAGIDVFLDGENARPGMLCTLSFRTVVYAPNTSCQHRVCWSESVWTSSMSSN